LIIVGSTPNAAKAHTLAIQAGFITTKKLQSVKQNFSPAATSPNELGDCGGLTEDGAADWPTPRPVQSTGSSDHLKVSIAVRIW
jgi:hypothetical protein